MSLHQLFHLDSRILSVVHAANTADSCLLITGGTGTGKSHLASTIHQSSKRGSRGSWHKINLATLSETLIESELFGHEKGAFTGAEMRRVGRLECCNGGTVFLDEIGELTPRLQAKLLDFIQYKKISPVGSNREIELDVRIVAATNRNLEEAVKAGAFRSDLYHRLNVFHIKLPDLAETPKAIIQFSRFFLENRAKQLGKQIRGFHPSVERAFLTYSWPGNIRELQNVIEFAVAMENEEKIQPTSLPFQLQKLCSEIENHHSGDSTANDSSLSDELNQLIEYNEALGVIKLPITMNYHECKDSFEKAYLEHALSLYGGQINETSRKIGLNKVSLTEKIRKYGIDWKSIRYKTLGPVLTKTAQPQMT